MRGRWLLIATLSLPGCDDGGGGEAVDAAVVDGGVGGMGGVGGIGGVGGVGGAGGVGGMGGVGGAGGMGGMGGGPPDCPVLLDLAGTDGPGPGYPAPQLAVDCANGRVRVTSNGIPHYRFVQITPNDLAPQNHVFEFPQDPRPAAEPSDIPLLGVAGVAVNGAPFYGPNEADRPDPFGDPIANGIMDMCAGHTAMRGDYHFHALPEACLTLAPPPADGPSPILGYALDGYPIHGPRGCFDAACDEVIEFKSSWEHQNPGRLDCAGPPDCAADEVCARVMIDGAERDACIPKTYAWDNNAFVPKNAPQFLDRCNGRVGHDGRYRYHTTSTFPYIIGCYHGATDAGGMMGMGGAGGGEPPAEDPRMACRDRVAGDACRFTGRDGRILDGTCVETMGRLECRPAR